MNKIETQIHQSEKRLFNAYGVDVSEHYHQLIVQGSPLRVRILEVGSGSPILFLHPISWFAASWVPLLCYIPNHRLICVDFPGHGLSDAVNYRKHAPRSHMVDLLKQLLLSLGIPQTPIPIVGNSLGGMAALWLALDEPNLVSQLFLLGVPGSVLPGGSKPNLGLALLTIPVINRLLLNLPPNPKRTRRMLAPTLGKAAFAKLSNDLLDIHQLASVRSEYGTTLSTFMQSTMKWRTPRRKIILSEAEIGKIQHPVHFIWGDCDEPEIGHRTVSKMQNATIQVRKGGHFPQFDDPEWCGHRITNNCGVKPFVTT